MSTAISRSTLFPEQGGPSDLWLKFNDVQPGTRPLPKRINLRPYKEFLGHLDMLVRRGYDFERMPFINPNTLPTRAELKAKSSVALERERVLIAFSVSRSAVEFLYYNKREPGSRQAELMSQQVQSLGQLLPLLGKAAEAARVREALALLGVEAQEELRIEALEAV